MQFFTKKEQKNADKKTNAKLQRIISNKFQLEDQNYLKSLRRFPINLLNLL